MGGDHREHHDSHIADPGKEARSASGIPIVPVFDGYRAFAILGVVMLHLITISGVVGTGEGGDIARITWGTFGRAVEILFVVSGFVVFLPTVARGGDFGGVKPYAIRRAARLLPAYWLVLVISLILIGTVNLSQFDLSMPNLESLVTNFTGTQLPASLISSHISIGFFVNTPLWTLSVELGFYLVLPLIAVRYFRHPWIGLGIAAAITALWDYAFAHVFDIAKFLGLHPSFDEGYRIFLGSGAQLPVWAFSFGLGMTGAWVYVRLRSAPRTPEFRRAVLGVIVTSVGATLALAWINGGYFDSTHESLTLTMAFSAALGVAMTAIALGPPVIRRPFANTAVRRLGDISYGIYLSHMLFMIYLGDLLSLPKDGGASSLLAWMAVVLPCSIAFGYLSARFLEQPIRRWARRFGRGGAATRAAAD
ncbi:MAG TPA: acyltransferase [Solirubrobacterales bacterium]|nr:acyltransferase [Solirubrobacterales bacterium]